MPAIRKRRLALRIGRDEVCPWKCGLDMAADRGRKATRGEPGYLTGRSHRTLRLTDCES